MEDGDQRKATETTSTLTFTQRRRFENGEDGYAGHHSVKVLSSTGLGHAYEVSIRTPTVRIFEGEVRFTLHRKMSFGN